LASGFRGGCGFWAATPIAWLAGTDNKRFYRAAGGVLFPRAAVTVSRCLRLPPTPIALWFSATRGFSWRILRNGLVVCGAAHQDMIAGGSLSAWSSGARKQRLPFAIQRCAPVLCLLVLRALTLLTLNQVLLPFHAGAISASGFGLRRSCYAVYLCTGFHRRSR